MGEPIRIDVGDLRTTVVMRNLPNSLNRDMLLKLLADRSFCRHCDFLYRPVDFATRRTNPGYAFINFGSHSIATRFCEVFNGFSEWPDAGQWPGPSRKVCKVVWNHPLQGLDAMVERYRNSPIMRADVPDICRPILLRHGVRTEFPAPTILLKAPRGIKHPR